jgi:hypothetical protein
MNTIHERLTADQIAAQSLVEELRSFARVEKRREQKIRFLRELGWWAVVVGAVALAVYSIAAR